MDEIAVHFNGKSFPQFGTNTNSSFTPEIYVDTYICCIYMYIYAKLGGRVRNQTTGASRENPCNSAVGNPELRL